jgi:tetratricopeptide (TPR) repeat protein
MNHNNLAGALSALDMIKEAIEEYKAAIECDASNITAHINLALAFCEANQKKEAIVSFRKAIELDPSLPELYAGLANVLRDEGWK